MRAVPLALLLAACGPVEAQRPPVYFDDFTYARVGTPTDGPGAEALLGTNRWLLSRGEEPMRSWRLGPDDETHGGAAAAYFGGPADLTLAGAGPARSLRLTMGAGFPHIPGAYVHPPMVVTGQTFEPSGTFAARARFSAHEPGQRLALSY